MPSIFRARATPTMSSRSPSDKIRRDLEQHRRRPRARRDPVAGLDDARQQIVDRGGALQFAQAGRVGRRNIEGDVACHRRNLFDQADVVGGAIAGILVGADIDADDAARFGARREPRQHDGRALAVEAEPVDHGPVRLQAKHPRARIAGLRQWRHGPDLDKAEAEAEQRVRNLGVLSKPGAIPTGLGEIEPKARTIRRESPAGGRRRGGNPGP